MQNIVLIKEFALDIFSQCVSKPVAATTAALALGSGLYFTGVALHFVQALYRHFLRPSRSPNRYGEWALVTGVTSGIGKEYVLALAERGMNIVLVARNEQLTKQVAEACAQKGVQTTTVLIDLSKEDHPKWEELERVINQHEIGLCVNNAGLSQDNPNKEYLHLSELKQLEDIQAVNVVALTRITQLVLPNMIARGKGCVINIGSQSAEMGGYPFSTVYAATKAYVDHFSRSLHMEYEGNGVVVQNHVPGFVKTNMSKYSDTSFFAPSASVWVASSLRFLGYEDYCMPYFPHRITKFLQAIVPSFIVDDQLIKRAHRIRNTYYAAHGGDPLGGADAASMATAEAATSNASAKKKS